MNYQEIIENLKLFYEDDFPEFAYADGDDVTDVGKFKEVEQHGGEDEGSDWYSVKFFPDHDVYIKVSGYYSSYNGTDFNSEWNGDVQEVRPVVRPTTFYEPIK